MRTGNSIRNIIFNIGGQILGILLNFICRTVFIKTLEVKFLGVSGLFGNILTILSLAEMGIGTAITYSMYKPLAENDKTKICALMNYYKRTYRVIGFIVAVIGLLILPFMDFIIKDRPDIDNLSLIYYLFLLNTVVTYFYSYKRSIIIADQKSYIYTVYHYCIATIKYIILILILIVTQNYILYLLISFFFEFIINFLVSKKADHMYPFLRLNTKERLEETSKNEITKNIRAMFMHKIGAIIVNNTDNLLIAKFFGLLSVFIYTNYKLILDTINMLFNQLFSAIIASIGNLGALESGEKTHKIYRYINFATSWMYGCASISLLILFNSAIDLWIGEEYLLDKSIVFVIVLNFYISGMRKCTLTFRDALGLFWYDRYKSIAEAAINLIASIILIQFLGIKGVFLGTILSTLLTSFWIEPLILFKYGFGVPVRGYFKDYIIHTVFSAVNLCITYYVSSFLQGELFYMLIIKIILCLFLTNIIYICVYCRTSEFKYFYNVVKAYMSKRMVALFVYKKSYR